MKHYYLTILFLLLTIPSLVLSQDIHTSSKRAKTAFKTALEYFDRMDDQMALEYCDKAIKADKNFVEAYMMKAQILKDQDNYPAAIENFETALAIDPDFYPEGFMVLASVQFNSGLYEEAWTNVHTFLEKGVFRQITEHEAFEFQDRISFALQAIRNPVPFNPENLGDSINTELNEYWPSLSLDESRIIFTVLLPKDMGIKSEPGFQEDFYFSDKDENGNWTRARNAGGFLNTEKNEGAQTLSADGRILYFTACDRMDGFGKCDLYVSYNHSDRWTSPLNLGGTVNSRYSDKHPSVSSDGRELYFASDRPGGKGGLDIWMTRKDKFDQWTTPINLGDSINTPGNEQSPFIHSDNKSLYFSSEGHQNLGKGDIFLSRRTNSGKWLSPVNLGYPINTHHNEIGLIVNASGQVAYFSSDRDGTRGMDIYRFELYPEVQPTPVSYMKGRVYNALTWKGIEAEFLLIDLSTGEVVIQAKSSPGEGDYLVPLPMDKNYALNVSHPGYLFYSAHFEFRGVHEATDPYILDVPLNPIRPGEKVVLNNIFFDFNKAELLKESEVELNKAYEFLIKNSGLRVRIAGHTDNIGGDEYNLNLSEKRARAVVDYLVLKGIDASRLEYSGYGASKPVADNSTEEGRSLNRRTELEILDQGN